jgi:glycolate oxidase FAD binding subunit
MQHLLGADRVREPAGAERLAALTVVEPRSEAEIAELVRKCESDRLTLAPINTGRLLATIRREPVVVGVALNRMAPVTAYEPDDMTITVQAGATLEAVNGCCAGRQQWLPADPPSPRSTTVGAMVAAARSGPFRLAEGSVRDLVIGIRFVGRTGRIVHGGGRVVKNVAGYDLMRVMTGSLGTLGVITKLTFKVRPLPEGYTIVLAGWENEQNAFECARRWHDALPLLHLEVLPPDIGVQIWNGGRNVGHGSAHIEPSRFIVIGGFGGNEPERAEQRAQFAALSGTDLAFVEERPAWEIYERLRDAALPEAALTAIVAVAPDELGRVVAGCGVPYKAHAGSGVAELFMPASTAPEAAAQAVSRWREHAREARGHVRVVAASQPVAHAVDPFGEGAQGTLRLMRRLKDAFDPAGIFNPGCFVGGI